MRSKKSLLSEVELEKYEASRDLAADLLQAVEEMKSGEVLPIASPVLDARNATGLSQTTFASLLGVSVRTLQDWENGRKRPSGAARTLILIAATNPAALRAVAEA